MNSMWKYNLQVCHLSLFAGHDGLAREDCHTIREIVPTQLRQEVCDFVPGARGNLLVGKSCLTT